MSDIDDGADAAADTHTAADPHTAVTPGPLIPPAARELHEPRPLIERIGLAAVAAVLAILFGGVAAASWVGGELFLTIMGAIACVMTVWVGVVTLIRG